MSPQTAVQTIALSGDYQQVPGTNANGIEATANGQSLIIVNSALGVLYSVNPNTGVASLIDLGGASVLNGDGLLLEGTLLYVVRNRLNVVEVFRLNPDLTSGTLLDSITSPAFDVPTTIARFGNALYLVNARFTTPPTPTTPYNIVRIAGLCDDPAEDCAPPMTLRIVPEALNLRSNAGLVAAVLGAAPGYSLGDWMLRDVRFGNTAALSFARASDGETYVATFPKSAFGSLPAGLSVGVTVSGTLANDAEQEPFSAGAFVNVIR